MNYTLEHQFDHRTFRKFKTQTMTPEQLQHIIHAASSTPTYTFLQAASIIHVTDQEKKNAIAAVCNQPYVAEAPDLFIVIADMYRNYQIATAKGAPTDNLDTADRFFATFYDATLMTMNMVTAAESMGLGCVILGSVNNDMDKMIDILNLPPHTFPCLGLGIGIPDQAPTLKPRLPHEFILMENSYQPIEDPLSTLEAYDAVVHEYYDLRDTNNRVDTFTNQMAKAMTAIYETRFNILPTLQKQGFLKR